MKIISGVSAEIAKQLELTKVWEYRYDVFVTHLGWTLPSQPQDRCETDQFDRPDTVYVVAFDERNSICGFARLLPTNKPYLLSEVFPSLLPQRPCSASVWELSRFCTVRSSAAGLVPSATLKVLKALLKAGCEQAIARGGEKLLTISPSATGRLLRKIGVASVNLSGPADIDGEQISVLEIPLNGSTREALSITAPGLELILRSLDSQTDALGSLSLSVAALETD